MKPGGDFFRGIIPNASTRYAIEADLSFYQAYYWPPGQAAFSIIPLEEAQRIVIAAVSEMMAGNPCKTVAAVAGQVTGIQSCGVRGLVRGFQLFLRVAAFQKEIGERSHAAYHERLGIDEIGMNRWDRCVSALHAIAICLVSSCQ